MNKSKKHLKHNSYKLVARNLSKFPQPKAWKYWYYTNSTIIEIM